MSRAGRLLSQVHVLMMQQVMHSEFLSRFGTVSTERAAVVTAILLGHCALFWVLSGLHSEHRVVQADLQMKATIISVPTQISAPTPSAPVLSPVAMPTFGDDLPAFEAQEVTFKRSGLLGQVALKSRGHRELTDVGRNVDRVVSPSEDPSTARLPIQRFAPAGMAQFPITARTVRIAIFVQSDGHVSDVIVEGSSGHPAVDQAAIEYVRTWKLIPGSRKGIPEAMWVSKTVIFPLT